MGWQFWIEGSFEMECSNGHLSSRLMHPGCICNQEKQECNVIRVVYVQAIMDSLNERSRNFLVSNISLRRNPRVQSMLEQEFISECKGCHLNVCSVKKHSISWSMSPLLYFLILF